MALDRPIQIPASEPTDTSEAIEPQSLYFPPLDSQFGTGLSLKWHS